MADYLTEGYKTIKCRCGCLCTIPFQTTVTKCPTCGSNILIKFFGTVIDKDGNYVH